MEKSRRYLIRATGRFLLAAVFAGAVAVPFAGAQAASTAPAAPPAVPDWALPGSPTHKQVPPPAGFHRPSRTSETPIGIFDGQSDIGAALVPGSASYDPATQQYTVHSAGYNIWYNRDEFRYLWKKVSGDVSLAADASFPNPDGYGDRKVVLVIRQSLDDDSQEAMLGEHGTGMIHLAWRASKGAFLKDMQYRFGGALTNVHARRIGIEKHGDSITIYASLTGEPMHPLGPPVTLHFDAPFYVGIGFCSLCRPRWTPRSSPMCASRTQQAKCARPLPQPIPLLPGLR